MKKDFGPFVLNEKIGSGAMASVYSATQKSLDRAVVLKILYPHLAEDEKLMARFEREARAVARLRHENIVQVIDFGRHEELAFIAMEYVEGSDLKQWMDRNGTPPIEIALFMLRDICCGVEHAHQHRIIHRDLKPANIMLTKDGVIKIMDFGLARRAEESSIMTMHGSVLGTPAYMSPEQANGETVDERSDIFSAGVVGYELLGGTRPFSGDTYSSVRHNILTVEPPPLQSLNPLAPSEAVAVVQRMLQKDAMKRYPSMDLVRGDVETVVESMGIHRGRDLMREYAREPAQVAEILRGKRLSRHLDQGLFYENMGLGKIDDALLEFRRVLFLDSSNKVALEHVKTLERERERVRASGGSMPAGAALEDASGRTVVLPPHLVLDREQAADEGRPSRARVKPPRQPSKPADRVRTLLWAAGAALALLVVAALFAVMGGPKGGEASIRVVTDPPGARVILDGKELPGLTNTTFPKIRTGTHSIRVEREGYVPEERRIEVRSGDENRFTMALASAPVATGGATGSLRVSTVPPGATVLVDGRALPGITNGTFPGITAGEHRVRLELPGHDPVERTVSMQKDQLAEITATFVSSAITPPATDLASLRVTTQPSGAIIMMDGVPQSRPSNTVLRNLRPGVHTFRFEKSGFGAVERRMALKPGQESRLFASLPVPQGSEGVLEIHALPYAEYLVDGTKRGANLPSIRAKVEAGRRHDVRIVHPTFGPWEWKSVWVGPGETVRLDHDFTKATGRIVVASPPNWAYILLDGKQTNHTTPYTLDYVPGGSHIISLVRDGFEVEGGPRTITVRPGKTINVTFQLRRR